MNGGQLPCARVKGPEWARRVHDVMVEDGVSCPGESGGVCCLSRDRAVNSDGVEPVKRSA